MKNNLLITGEPGSGKTTVLLMALKEYLTEPFAGKVGGIYTTEMLAGSERVGFKLRVIGGGMATLAHTMMYSFSRQLGRYHVDTSAVYYVGLPAIMAACESAVVVVIDEVARMQLMCDDFSPTVVAALDGDKPVVATVHSHSGSFTDEIKRRADVELVTVTPETREQCLAQIQAWLRHYLPL
mgnify:CR=1 FL=1|jgi:nucleoside-triphosphatase